MYFNIASPLSITPAPPAIPDDFTGNDTHGNATGAAAEASSNRNPVSAKRMERNAEHKQNAQAAAAGVTETHFGPNQRSKKKRHVDTQDIIDNLFAPQRTEASNVENMVGGLVNSLKGSPGKQKNDKKEQLNRLINQYEESAKNKLALGLCNKSVLEKIKETEAERDAL